jgi:hypothetical protein
MLCTRRLARDPGVIELERAPCCRSPRAIAWGAAQGRPWVGQRNRLRRHVESPADDRMIGAKGACAVSERRHLHDSVEAFDGAPTDIIGRSCATELVAVVLSNARDAARPKSRTKVALPERELGDVREVGKEARGFVHSGVPARSPPTRDAAVFAHGACGMRRCLDLSRAVDPARDNGLERRSTRGLLPSTPRRASRRGSRTRSPTPP